MVATAGFEPANVWPLTGCLRPLGYAVNMQLMLRKDSKNTQPTTTNTLMLRILL